LLSEVFELGKQSIVCEGDKDSYGKLIHETDIIACNQKYQDATERIRQKQLTDDKETSETWLNSGVNRTDLDYADKLPPNNRKCRYHLKGLGPEYVKSDDPEDRQKYYEAPILPNENLDHETLSVDNRERNRQAALEAKVVSIASNPYELSSGNDDLFRYQYDMNNEGTAPEANGTISFPWRSEIGQDADPDYTPCNQTYYPYKENQKAYTENYKIVRPDLPTVNMEHKDYLTEDVPCQTPSQPWLEDPHDTDPLNRPYCKKQSVPCETCGTFRGSPMYGSAEVYGPNKVKIHDLTKSHFVSAAREEVADFADEQA